MSTPAIRRITNALMAAAVFLAFLSPAGAVDSAACERDGYGYRHATDIRVWLDDDGDVYPSEDGVVFYLRAAGDCYATVYVVDTDGFIHVVFPFGPDAEAFVRGGIVYRFEPDAYDIFHSPGQRGIAYIFAVASPVPFVYSSYGLEIFAGTAGFRIYGDPFIACKRFYVSLLPPRISLELVSVSVSHFYVREWVPYPRYLYFGYGYEVDPYDYEFNVVYRAYREHHNNPYRVLKPTYRLPAAKRKSARIVRAGGEMRKRVALRGHGGKRKVSRRINERHSVMKPQAMRDRLVTRRARPGIEKKIALRDRFNAAENMKSRNAVRRSKHGAMKIHGTRESLGKSSIARKVSARKVFSGKGHAGKRSKRH